MYNVPSIFKEFDNSFNDLFYRNLNYEVEALEDKYVIYLDVPGCSKSNTSVKLVNGLLSVVVERKGNRAASFRTSFKLPNNASSEVSAVVSDGVLTLTIPKLESSKPKLIEVN